MKKSKFYYHITNIKNKEEILKNGLNSNSGQIWVTDREEQIIFVASNQVFLNEFSVFAISSNNITGKIEPDRVAEVGAKFQFIINQKCINPEHLIHIRDESWNKWEILEKVERKRYELMGRNAEEILRIFIQSDAEWCEHYNKKYGYGLEYKPISTSK
jgi:hypothetical protein